LKEQLKGIENKQTGIENVQALIAKELGIEDRIQNVMKVPKDKHH
jgi:hypothetical protein